MNIKKFLKKLAQIADFQQPTEVVEQPVQPVGQPSVAQPGQIDTGVAQTGPLAPVQESPSVIQTTVAEWRPSRGANKGKTYYYLQLINVPAGPGGEILTELGYKYNAKFGSWSKQVKEDNVLKINSELDTIEQKFGVTVARDAISKLQEIFGFTGETSTEMGGSTAEDVKKIKFVEEGQQQEIAESLLKNKLEEMVNNLNSEETKAFLEEYLSVKKATSGKVHPYSFLNSMLISWQNRETNPETGEMARRSGFIAPASLWEKEFGRKLKEGTEGMEIFVPKGGKREMKGAGQASLLKAIGQFMAMNKGNLDLTNDDNARKFFGFLKSLVLKKKMYQSNFLYLTGKFNKNREQFKTVKDIADYLGGMLDSKKTETYYTNTTFMIKPVIFDMDQTEVIPGQEHKDPKPKIEAIRGMWLGMRNEPNKLIDTLYDALARSASNGILIPGKNINIQKKGTGNAGGYSSGGEIVIDETSAGSRAFRTLVHEVAHEILYWGSDKAGINREQSEIDADATAYIILNHYGVGTGSESLNYIALLVKDDKGRINKKAIMDRLQPVLKASNAIISAIEKQKGMEYDMGKTAKSNWYKKFKVAHYSEPEEKGEGYGTGEKQFDERRLEDWTKEHREEIVKMKEFVKKGLRGDWVGFNAYKQQLMNKYNSPENEQIVAGIVSAAMHGQRL